MINPANRLREMSLKGSSLEEMRDFVLNEVMGEMRDLDVVQDVLAAVQKIVRSKSNLHVGQNVEEKARWEQLLSTLDDRVRAIEDERSSLMLNQMKMSISEATDCGVESGDVYLSRDDFNECIKRAHPHGQVALPSTSTFTDLRDDSFPFTKDIFVDFKRRRAREHDEAVGGEASELLTKLTLVLTLEPLGENEENPMDPCALIREVVLFAEDGDRAEILRLALEDKYERVLRNLCRASGEILRGHCQAGNEATGQDVLMRCFRCLILTARFCLARLRRRDVDYGMPRLAATLSLLSDIVGFYWCYRNYRQWSKDEEKSKESEQVDRVLLGTLHASLAELKSLSGEEPRATRWQDAALHAIVAGSAKYTVMRGASLVLHYCTEKDVVGCGAEIFACGWSREACLPGRMLEKGGPGAMLLRCLITCGMEKQLFPVSSASPRTQKQWILQHKQRFLHVVGHHADQWGDPLGTYRSLLIEACARHLENSQHAHAEALREREIRVKVRALARLFGFSAKDVLYGLGEKLAAQPAQKSVEETSGSAISPSNYDDFVASVMKCEQDWGMDGVDDGKDLSGGGGGERLMAALSDSLVHDSPDSSLKRLQLVNRVACQEDMSQDVHVEDTSSSDFALSWLASRPIDSYARHDALRQVQSSDCNFIFTPLERAIGAIPQDTEINATHGSKVGRLWAYLGCCSRLQVDLTLSEVIMCEIMPQPQSGGDSLFFFDHRVLVPNLLSLTFFLLHLGRASVNMHRSPDSDTGGSSFRASLDVLAVWRENRCLIVAPALTRALKHYLELLTKADPLPHSARSTEKSNFLANISGYIFTVTQLLGVVGCPAQTAGHLLAKVVDKELYRAIVAALLTRQESHYLSSSLKSAIDLCMCVLCGPYVDNTTPPAFVSDLLCNLPLLAVANLANRLCCRQDQPTVTPSIDTLTIAEVLGRASKEELAAALESCRGIGLDVQVSILTWVPKKKQWVCCALNKLDEDGTGRQMPSMSDPLVSGHVPKGAKRLASVVPCNMLTTLLCTPVPEKGVKGPLDVTQTYPTLGEARVASVLLGCASQGHAYGGSYRKAVLEEALLVIWGYFSLDVDARSLRVAAVVLQTLYAHPSGKSSGSGGNAETEIQSEYRGMRHLWEVLQQVRLTPRRPEHVEGVVFAVGELWKGKRLTSSASQGNLEDAEKDEEHLSMALTALNELLRYVCCHIDIHSLSCGFDPVSAFAEAWCGLFSASDGGGCLKEEELLGSLGLLLFWRESCLPGTSESLLSNLAFRCQRERVGPLSVAWEDLARRARGEVNGIVVQERVPPSSYTLQSNRHHSPPRDTVRASPTATVSSVRSTPSSRGSRLGDIIRSSTRSGRKRARLDPIAGIPLDLSEFEASCQDSTKEEKFNVDEMCHERENMDSDDLLLPVPSRRSKSKNTPGPDGKPGYASNTSDEKRDDEETKEEVEKEKKREGEGEGKGEGEVQGAIHDHHGPGRRAEGWAGEEAEAIAAKFGAGFGGFR